MQIVENFHEGIRSIRGSLLRSTLTALIIAIGITSLVGILTAIEGIKVSVTNSFSNFGGNSFEITNKRSSNISQQGKKEKVFPPLEYFQVSRFKERFDEASRISVSTRVTGNAEVKYRSEKTNPNVRIRGVDDAYLVMRSINIEDGRNFTNMEVSNASNVAIVGASVYEQLFAEGQNVVNRRISFYGNKFRIVGKLAKEGAMGGESGSDRSIFIPLETARRINRGNPSYEIDVEVADPATVNAVMDEARGFMRAIRKDPPGSEDSFDLEKNESAAESLEEISGYLRIGGFSIGFITLLGASIGLMNIMLVSVTERTREIGIRKAVGANPSRIRQQFLMEAILICQLGGLAGVIVGIGIGNLVSILLSSGQFIIPWVWIFTGLLVCLAVGIISGYYPAFKASRLDPISALHFE